MDNILEQLESLQSKLKDAESKKLRLDGQLDAIKSEMKNLGYSSIEQLKEKQLELTDEIEAKEVIIQMEIDLFTNKFRELLNEL